MSARLADGSPSRDNPSPGRDRRLTLLCKSCERDVGRDDEANHYLRRTYREPWVVPER